MRHFKIFLFILGAGLSFKLFAQKADPKVPYIYQVERGDELGELMYSLGLTPLWGKTGSVLQAAKLNPKYVHKNGNLILPLTELRLPQAPLLKCNVVFDRHKVTLIRKVKTEAEFKQMIAGFNDSCDTNAKSFERKPASLKKVSNHGHSRLGFTPFVSFSRIDGTEKEDGSRASILSKVNYGGALKWDQHWSNTIKSYALVSFEQQTYRSSNNRSLNENSVSLINAGLGISLKPISLIGVKGELSFGEELFLIAPDTSTLQLEKGNAGKGSLALEVFLIKKRPFDLSVQLGVSYLAESKLSSLNSQGGGGSFGKIRLVHDDTDKSIFGEILYLDQNKETDYFVQEDRSLRFSFGMNWRWGE